MASPDGEPVLVEWPRATPQATVLALPREALRMLPDQTARQLAGAGPLARIPTASVWEAAATAVIRQVVHRNQARAVFERLVAAHGRPVLAAGAVRHAFPDAETVVDIGERGLRALGVGFKAATLLRLAQWAGNRQTPSSAQALHEELLDIKGVGPWTAAITVTDLFSDFRYYPVDDLAVRTLAAAIWPAKWPADPGHFAAEWRARTEPHTAAITAHVLGFAAIHRS